MCECGGTELVLSVIAIGISLFTLWSEIRSQKKLNRINLNAEYFKHLFFDKLLKEIPEERENLYFDSQGILKGYGNFVDLFLSILNDSKYYKYMDKSYYDYLKEEIMDLEDYVYTVPNGSVEDALHQEIFNEIDEKVQRVYDRMTDKYEKG